MMLSVIRRLGYQQTIRNECRCRIAQFRKKSEAVNLQGLVASPLVPLDRNGEVDLSQVEKCAQHARSTHFDGVFVTGTIGEGVAMSCSERKKIAEKWKEHTDNNLFLIVHIGTGNLKESQELARHAEQLGVHAIAALPPTYQKPKTEDQLVDYLQQVAAAAPNTPFLYYDYNIATGVYLNVARAFELAETRIPTLYGMKHTSPELPSALNCSLVCGGKYKVFFGTESMYLPTLSLGIPDVITVPFFGDIFHGIKKAYDSGNMAEAQKLQRRAQQLVDIQAKHGGGIACAKAVFELLTDIPVGPPRLPLHALTPERTRLLQEDLEAAGFM